MSNFMVSAISTSEGRTVKFMTIGHFYILIFLHTFSVQKVIPMQYLLFILQG